MDGTEERKMLVAGKTAGKFLEVRFVERGRWGMMVEEGVVAQLSGSGGLRRRQRRRRVN